MQPNIDIYQEKFLHAIDREKYIIKITDAISIYDILGFLNTKKPLGGCPVPVTLANKRCEQLYPYQILPPETYQYLCKLSADPFFLTRCSEAFLHYLLKGRKEITVKYMAGDIVVVICKRPIPIAKTTTADLIEPIDDNRLIKLL